MLKQFYEKALPSQGVYCVSGIEQTTKKTTNRFAETLEDVFKLIDKFKGQEQNVFVALGSFDGFSRKADNCVFYKSFFIDLDVGEGKAYADKGEAQAALWKFLGETGLPDPVCVDSGGGMHAYWIMDVDIPIEEYLPYAHKFKDFALSKISADPAVMADAARIMRCPETFNHKFDPPQPTAIIGEEINVYGWEEFKQFLDSLETEVQSPDPFANVRKGLDEDTLAMKKLDNYDWSFQLIAERSLSGEGCNQIEYMLLNQQTVPRDQWAAGLTIAVHCADGATAIHDMSNEYDKYNYDETEKTARSFGGPRTCEWFAENFPEQCNGCKHRGRINTPIVLGKVIKEATEESDIPVDPLTTAATTENPEAESVWQTPSTEKIPVFPDYIKPFIRGQNGGVYYVPPPSKDKKGNPVYEDPYEILPHILYPTRRLYSPLDGECMTMHLILPNDGLKQFLLPMKSVYALEELKKTLSFNQVIYTPAHINKIQEYIVKWSQYMVNIHKAQQMRMQLGWTELKTDELKWHKRGFVTGMQEINHEGEIVEAAISPYIRVIASYLKPAGTFERWQESANELNRPGFELHAMTCIAGMASTLMAYMSVGGVTISLMGRSGCAKTGAMYSGISAFGDPRALSVFDSTDNGLIGRLLGLKNLMFGVDEVGNKDPKPLSQLIHAVTQGKGKIKMQASVNAERPIDMYTALIAILTTNESIYNKFEVFKGSPDGEAARLIEFLVEQPEDLKGQPGRELGRHIFDAFKYNYGHAGPRFIAEVFSIGDAHIEMRIDHWRKRYGMDIPSADASDRYYEDYVAAVFTAGEIAVNAGIVNYDLERIYKKIIKEIINIKTNVIKVNNTDYSAILNDFIYENMGNILRIKDGKVTDEPRGKLVARISTDEPMRISKEALKEYLHRKKISPREFEKVMVETGDMVDKSAKKHLETGWKPTTSTKAGYVYLFRNDYLDDKSDTNN